MGNRLRVSESVPHTPTEFFWKYPPPLGVQLRCKRVSGKLDIFYVLRGLFQCDHVKVLAFDCKLRNMQFDMQRHGYFSAPTNFIDENWKAVFGSFKFREFVRNIVVNNRNIYR